jgi:hypothetical protein
MAYGLAIFSTAITALLFASIVSNSNPGWSVIQGTLKLLYRNREVTFAFSSSPTSSASRYVAIALILSFIFGAMVSLILWR